MIKKIGIVFSLVAMISCSSSTGIFPSISTSTNENTIVLPNPISVVVDTTNSRVVVANSNVDIFFNQGSMAVLTVDASDTDNPVLAAGSVLASPNFAGRMFFDGANSIFVPFRETSTTNAAFDTIVKYTMSGSTITETSRGAVSPNPFGITGSGGRLYVVSDDVFTVMDSALNSLTTVDLTAAETAGLTSADSSFVLSVAEDTANNLAVVSNPGGKAFIINLANNTLIQAITSPVLSSDLLIDANSRLYLLDSAADTLYVYDLNSLPAVTGSTPQDVDDSTFIITAIGVGDNPNALALDAANNRLYVANTGDDTISVIDTSANLEIARLSLDAADIDPSFNRDGDEPLGLALGTFNGVNYLFIACFKSNSVVVVNTARQKVVEVYPNTKL